MDARPQSHLTDSSSASDEAESMPTEASDRVYGRKVDVTLSLASMALSLYLIVSGFDLGLDTASLNSAGLAPVAYGLLLLVASAALLLKSLRTSRQRGRGDRNSAEPANRVRFTRESFANATFHLRRPLALAVSVVVYVLLLNLLGYLIATFGFTLFVLFFMGWRGWKWIAGSVGLTAVTYGLFVSVLHVYFPTGIWG